MAVVVRWLLLFVACRRCVLLFVVASWIRRVLVFVVCGMLMFVVGVDCDLLFVV